MNSHSDSGRTGKNGSPRSIGELQGMGRLHSVPGEQAFRSAVSLKLPAVQGAPSLEGIEVTLPTPARVSEGDIVERFDELCRTVAPRRDREAGEAVAAGDEVLLDVIGYSSGKLIPFSIRLDWWTQAAPNPMLPGFFEALVGARVGEALSVELTLPSDYPVERLRGARARFGVELQAARRGDSPAVVRGRASGAHPAGPLSRAASGGV